MKDRADKKTVDFFPQDETKEHRYDGHVLYCELYKKFSTARGIEEISVLVMRGVYPGNALAKIPYLSIKLYLGEEIAKKIFHKK